ncbi:uncharacterized protein LOC118434287 [Folsomia candida]|uniref:uncharacterized protein LOC118434287 n=1 Tax=Folsomia candida TaxID=158441 RepID=UPI001604D4CC|nr:uncharacterized protein LOC118434287 [Folsomia candida]
MTLIPDECDLKCSPDDNNEYSALLATTPKPASSPQPTNLNSEMLKHMVDSMFTSGVNSTQKVVLPDARLNLLEKLFDIARNVCSCMVPTTFLDNALHLFKVAYATGNYEYGTDFRKSEIDKIGDMLTSCLDQTGDKAILCERNECNGRASQMSELEDVTLKTTPVDDTGYVTNPLHHLIEVVWHAVEIWSVGCIREFRESYLLYHELEQVMEKLFVGEIRKLWHNPSIPPNYYQHLLGPNEEIHMSNLKDCVKAIYESNPKALKLIRPKSSPPIQLGNTIRNRKRTQEFFHERLSKSIFCSKEQFCLD